MEATKSHSPWRAMPSTISRESAWMWACILSIIRLVKPLLTSFRSLVCLGASWLIIHKRSCAMRSSLMSVTTTVRRSDEKRFWSREISMTSSWRVTAQ